jgi:hypothetical protein
MTHTYAVLEVSPAAYAEIREKLDAAGYDHAFDSHSGAEVIDMHGIALRAEVKLPPIAPPPEPPEQEHCSACNHVVKRESMECGGGLGHESCPKWDYLYPF